MACAMFENYDGPTMTVVGRAELPELQDKAAWLEQQPLLKDAGAVEKSLPGVPPAPMLCC